MNLKTFMLYSFIGSLIWAASLGVAGYFAGPHWESLMKIFKGLDYVVFAGILLIAGFYVYKGLKNNKT